MRWFEEGPMPEAPRRAKFAQVPATARRQPSWLPSSQRSSPKRESPSMKPPRLPAEFVDAVRQELGEMPQPERRSLRPSEAAARPPTMPPPDAFAAVEPGPLTAAPQPIVDQELTHAFEEAVELL